ncbi:hypothetical protein PEC730217_01650 [Pectobacterium carotovorum subsp. carotovorum]|uniref:putative phage tail assembly chaperone n=1 Tax=Pectobacterium TaxID=122277 RepID=UPI0004E63C27|nr:putative phage tail assembly chaperone [Pectobacterium brasiliense]KFF72115.1 hypothetical protein IW01_05715 [Pectobacterium brasiliense]GKW31385.1 hypothetical protein PEC730217_01650 [Pectobacterium carotovorum subsp. carotovorum]
MSKETNVITLTVNGRELSFAPTLVAYNKLSNEAARDGDVIGTIATYLKRIVTPDTRDALNELLQRPGYGTQIAKKVNEIYAPEVEIEVKG